MAAKYATRNANRHPARREVLLRAKAGVRRSRAKSIIRHRNRLAELAKTIKGEMIITVNDVPEMQEAFAGLSTKTVGINYTVGGSHKPAKRTELIIRNF